MSNRTATTKDYTIREAAKLSGLPESTLRYYETIGLIGAIKRDPSSKHRVYSEQDLTMVDAVACLNATGMSLQDMRIYMQNAGSGPVMADEQIKLLENLKQRLRDEASHLKVRQEYVDLKLSFWDAAKRGDDAEVHEILTRARRLANELKHTGK